MKITEIVCQILRIKNVEAKTAGSQDSVLIRVKTDKKLPTVGFGDIAPVIPGAKIITMVQMVANFVLLGLLVRVLASAARKAKAMKAKNSD